MTTSPFGMTILHACRSYRGGSMLATKQYKRKNGVITKQEIRTASFYRFIPVEFDSLADGNTSLATILTDLATHESEFIVRGRGSGDPGEDPRRPKVRQWVSDTPTLFSCPRRWIALDLDGVAVPEPLGRPERVADAGAWIRDNVLPPEFIGRQMIATATSSTGLQGPAVARLRLWGLLDKPALDEALKAWATAFRATVCDALDPIIFQPGQPIFTARPLFEGMDDPVPRECWVVALPGASEPIPLNLHRYVPEYSVKVREIEDQLYRFGRDWRKAAELLVGHKDLGYFEPLSKTLGAAVGSDADPAEIIAFFDALVKAKAIGDPIRLKNYDRRWITRTVRRFHRRDTTLPGPPPGDLTPEEVEYMLSFGIKLNRIIGIEMR